MPQMKSNVKPNNHKAVHVTSIQQAWTSSNEPSSSETAAWKKSEIRKKENNQQQSNVSSISVNTNSSKSFSDYKSKLIKSSTSKSSKTKNSEFAGWKLCLILIATFAALCSLAALSVGLYSILRPAEASKNSSVTSTSLSLRWKTEGTIVAGVGGMAGSNTNQLYNPAHVYISSSNELYISDFNNDRVQRWIIGESAATTVAGQANGVGGSALMQLSLPFGVTFDSAGNLYIADSGNHRVQRWSNGSLSGTIVAGTGVLGNLLNQLNAPYDVSRDSATGILYIADSGNHRIMSYASGATVGTIAAGGNGLGSLSIQLASPRVVYFDSLSNSLFIVNGLANNVVRWIIGTGGWTLVAGHPYGSAGSTNMMFNTPYGLTLDPMGNVYVADTVNHRIQLFLAGQKNGTTIAGTTGIVGSTNSLLYHPYGVALDSALNLYVADTSNQRIIMFERY